VELFDTGPAALSGEVESTMSGEAGDLEDADGSGPPAWSADVEECSTWCLDGLDGRDWLTPSA